MGVRYGYIQRKDGKYFLESLNDSSDEELEEEDDAVPGGWQQLPSPHPAPFSKDFQQQQQQQRQ